MSLHDAIVGMIIDDKYRIEKPLGRGGMGAVYLATHLGTSRPVALKLITPALMKDETVVERFKREARAAGQLRHPNVVNVTDFGISSIGDQKIAYLVMEHLQGLTLAQLLEKQKKLPLRRVVDILQQVCAAVEEAHRHGIIHRDLKPENIWLEPRGRSGQNVKVLDFGVAKLREGQHATQLEPVDDAGEPLALEVDPQAPTLQGPPSDPAASTLASPPDDRCGSEAIPDGITPFGTLLGTPLYMSPEQWLQRRVDARSDVYSLGVIAYRMLAGEVPFTGRASSIFMQHLRAAPQSLQETAPGVPPAVVAVVMAALAKSPAGRPPSAQSFVAALAAGAEGAGAVLGRATVLCAMHFSSLLGVNVTVFGPALAACALRLASRLLVNAGVVPSAVGAVVGVACLGVYLLSMVLLQPVAAGLFQPRVRELLLAPHEPPRPRPTFGEIAACLRVTLAPTLVLVACAAAIALATRQPPFLLAQRAGLFPEDALDLTPLEMALHALIEIPGLVVVSLLLSRYVAYPSVVTAERIGGLASLRRSASLTRPFRRTAAMVLGLHFATRLGILWLLWLALAPLGRVSILTVLATSMDSAITDVDLLLITSLQVVIWTFTFAAMAVVYLNGRHAEGVTLEAMAEAAAEDPAPADPRLAA
jgi:serine/threonine protein kinase